MTSQRSSPQLLRSNSSNDDFLTRSRHNTVLSTSFVSTRKLEEQPSTPMTPLGTRRTRSGTIKSISNLKHDIHHVQQDLIRLRKSKEDAEKRRESATVDIYPGNYSQEHLQRHSMVLQSKDQLRKLDQQIKKSGDLLTTLRYRLDSTSSAATEDTARSAVASHPSFLRKDPKKLSESALTNDSATEDDADEVMSPPVSESESASLEGFGDIRNVQSEALVSKPSSREAKASKEHATWLVGDYLQSLEDRNSPKEVVVAKANDLVSLLKQNPTIKFDLVLPAFSNSIQELMLSEDEVTVSAAYRICRYLITGPEFIQKLRKLHLEPLLVISLAKSNASQIERLQAMKLIRAFLEYDAGLSIGIAQAVISCVEKSDDKLMEVAILTLLELCYIKPALVKRCGGMRVLQSIIAENPLSPLSPFILDSILDLMTFQDTRQNFIDCFNASFTLATLADSQVKLNLSIDKLQASINLICKFLKNYNGLILFSQDNFRPFKELFAFFQFPSLSGYLVDLFLDVLRIKPLAYPEKKKTSQVLKMTQSHFQSEVAPINQYMGLLTNILYKLHFIDNLVPLLSRRPATKMDTGLAAKTRYLITEYCIISTNLAGLRPSASADLLFPEHGAFQNVFTQVFQYEKVTNKLNKNRNTIGMTELGSINNILGFSERSKREALVSQVDEVRFKKMVFDTRVLQTKDFSLWNWGILLDLIEGPLLSPKRLEDLAKTTKFFRRLLVFYRPMRYRFSKINRNSRLAGRCVHVGCNLIKTLTSTAEGIRILNDDTKLLPQIASLLFKAMEGQTSGNVFSEQHLAKSVCSGYFKIIGAFSENARGCKTLEKWNIFTVIYKMFQNTSTLATSYLLCILPELDIVYSYHTRTILSKALVHPLEKVRVESTNLLGARLQKTAFESNSSPRSIELEKFLLELVIRQLYDLSPTVVAAADKILYGYCALQDWPPNVDTQRHHLLNQLIFIRSPILLEFLKTSVGFKQLNDIGFVATEREKWLNGKNREYVGRVEEFIQKEMLNPLGPTSQMSTSKRRLPMHFFHSLASTEEGVALIAQKGDFVAIVNTIKQYKYNRCPDLTVEEHLELKAALWCCGYIGSTIAGIQLLDTYSVSTDIAHISFAASSTTIKFTAFYALGLIASTDEGCEILDELGWSCSLNVQGVPLALAFPKNIGQFLSFPEINGRRVIFKSNSEGGSPGASPTLEPVLMDLDLLLQSKAELENTMGDEQEEVQAEVDRQARNLEMFKSQLIQTTGDELADKVMRAVSKLNNHILSNAAAKEITELLSTYGPARFESGEVFSRALTLMEQFRFKPQARRFLCETLVSKKTLVAVIKRERKKVRRKEAG
ncbi:LAME_0F10792g1_1 [Lachancea meyersii CBS 8951]|uniref:LAME_0F10792g1_1 n=1 Tax=Lachancea meyersii CBS 8951 TaxID=1266667 RepID=A0A1G4JVR9_9SACH|nr:LAME_0F10792g1_1 [Lachancea meyersii CBS 8951]